VLQWAIANGCPWDARTCIAAADGGHLVVLQWARANACLWDAHTCAAAAKGGHLSVLRWVHEHGCPWDEGTCTMATEEVQLRSLAWAIQHGCACGTRTDAAANAVGHRHGDGSLSVAAHAVLHVISLVKGRMAAMGMPQ
jgi:hypothetical protein